MILLIAFRNIFRNFRRSALCIAAIMVAVFFIVALQSYMGGMIASMNDTIQIFDTAHINVVHREYAENSDFFPLQYPIEPDNRSLTEIEQEISEIDGVTGVFERITAVATLRDSAVKHGIIWGVDFEKELKLDNIYYNLRSKDSGIVSGRFPEIDPDTGRYRNECVLGIKLAERLGINIGDKLDYKIISSQYSEKLNNPVVTGFIDFNYETMNGNYILVPYQRIQRLATLSGMAQKIVIYIDPAKGNLNEIKAKIVDIFNNNDLVIKTWLENPMVLMMNQTRSVYYIIYGVFIVVASFLIINTIIMIIHERIKEIGMMGSLGMTKFQIVLLFITEAVMLSIIGSLAGVIISGILTAWMQTMPIDLMKMTGGAEMPVGNTLFFDFSFKYLLNGFLIGTIISGLCTLIPSLRSAFIEPVEALRR